ncbi:putative rRNA-processing protein [Triangularia verruculosa]|uniref:U three protein 23 n=1 Tax=Triangularia verruculosa TaxID=2587418 RepID=A0AAN6XJ60_9PEZI|nr:putative rRNA-processing protein [Triangularia verruculosa]
MGKRTKQYKKLMRSFQMLGFREPYQLLMTSDIVLDTMKLDLMTLFEKALSTKNLKPMITQCCIRAMYAKNKEPGVAAAIERAKTFERRRCGHLMDEDPLTERECVMAVVDPKRKNENKFRYVVATQDEMLREKLRSVVPTPLMYVKRSVLILEPMAEASQRVRDKEEKAKFMSGIVRGTSKRKREEEEEEEEDEDDKSGSEDEDDKDKSKSSTQGEGGKPKKKKKNYGKKGPNPLAVKKAKKVTEGQKEQRPGKEETETPAAETPGEHKTKRKRRKKTTAGEGASDKEIAAAVEAAVAGADMQD